jgi:hypothetical protein
MNVFLLMALSLAPVHGHTRKPVDLHYRCAGPLAAPASWMPAAATDAQAETVDLKEVALGLLDGHAPRLARYVRGRTVLLPLVSRTAAGETALGAAVQLSSE